MSKYAKPSNVMASLEKAGISTAHFMERGSWPREYKSGYYSGKFEPGELVKVSLSKGVSSAGRFKNWIGKEGIVIGWQRSGGYGGQSEYKVFNPETGKARWIWADMLEEM